MNKVFLIGNLTRDPELTETAGGVKICRFAIAVNRRNTNGEEVADFYNCTAWRGLGESVARYARKGNKVAVSGNIELRNYEDAQGVKRTGIDIIAHDVEFLTPKTNAGNGGTNGSDKSVLQPFDDDTDIPF